VSGEPTRRVSNFPSGMAFRNGGADAVATGLTEQQAAQRVDRHVEPKACFVTRDSGRRDDWRPLTGTGCAHWVAHQLGLKGGTAGSNACMQGYILRVPDLVSGRPTIELKDVKVNDIWTNVGLTHTGLIFEIRHKDGVVEDLTIRHCSSGQGGVVDSPWKSHFGGKGRFYRHTVDTTACIDKSIQSRLMPTSYPEREAFS
jgi:hypothetical protein